MNKLELIKEIRKIQNHYMVETEVFRVINSIIDLVLKYDDYEGAIKEALGFDQDYPFSELEKRLIIKAIFNEFGDR